MPSDHPGMGRIADWWNGVETRAEETPPPSDPSTVHNVPSRSQVTRAVGQADALGLSMVFRAIQIHAVSVTQLSLDAFRGGEVISPAPAFIRTPDIDSSRAAFLEMTTVSLAVSGNAYWEVTRDNQNRVTNLTVLNPHDVTIDHTQRGRVTGYQYLGRVLRPEQVQHLSLLRVPGTPYGLGPIQAAQKELRGAIDSRDYASNWFSEAGVPTGILSSDQPLTPEQAEDARTRWTDQLTQNRGVSVLGRGLSYTPIYLSPKDALWIETQNFTVTQMARLFGVPSSLMLATVEGNTKTYANVAQDWLGYVRFSLMAYLREIEMAFSALLPRGSEARFNVEGLLRSDTKSRYDAHAIALQNRWMTVNEVRAIENLPPLPGGDELAKPSAAPAPAEPAPEEAPDA